MFLEFTNAEFIKSSTQKKHYPPDIGYEVAFVGRSNSGKSSLINSLCCKHNLCKVGKKPGKTRLINFFSVGDEVRLVDLPGYGYAEVSKSMRADWSEMIESYLHERHSLILLVIVMDIRHPLKPQDQNMLDWVAAYNIPVYLVLTKGDKISAMQAKNQLYHTTRVSGLDAQISSSLHRKGVQELRARLYAQLDFCRNTQTSNY